MAKQTIRPVNGIAPLTGKAAEWLEAHLETAEPDPKAQEAQFREDLAIVAETLKKALGS